MTCFFSRASLAVSGARCVIVSGESLLESLPSYPANKAAAKVVLRSWVRAVLYSCIFIVLYHIHVAMLLYGTTLVQSNALVMIIMILTPAPHFGVKHGGIDRHRRMLVDFLVYQGLPGVFCLLS